jgi:type 1 fimbria pilin
MRIIRIFTACLTMTATAAGAASAQMSAPIPMTAAQFGRAATGQPVQIVVRVVSRNREAMQGELLNRKSEGAYAATGIRVNLYVADDTPIVMGSPSDLTPGGVVFVNGVATTAGNADAKRLIVLTKYVTVR